jgi:hypothetical protein
MEKIKDFEGRISEEWLTELSSLYFCFFSYPAVFKHSSFSSTRFKIRNPHSEIRNNVDVSIPQMTHPGNTKPSVRPVQLK